MLVADPAGDLLSLRPCGLGVVLSNGRTSKAHVPATTETNVGGHVCEVPSSALRRLQAGMPSCHTAQAAASTEQLEQPGRVHHGTSLIMGLRCCQMPINRRVIGLVSLLQRCRRTQASASTLVSRREPTPMQTTLVLHRTMRVQVASPCPHSYSFPPDLT